MSTLVIDSERAAEAGKLLIDAMHNGGIFGFTATPQSKPPISLPEDLEARVRFITFSVQLDYLRDSTRLYDAGRATYDDERTRWLYDPYEVANASYVRVTRALKTYGLSQREGRDADVWMHNAKRLVDNYDGSVLNLLDTGDWNGPKILRLVGKDGFMSLSGPKVGPLWIRMINSDIPNKMQDLVDVPIPVDRHIGNSSFAIGAIIGGRNGLDLEHITHPVQKVWQEAGRLGGFMSLDLDIPLWHLGRVGCSKPKCAQSDECPVRTLCMK